MIPCIASACAHLGSPKRWAGYGQPVAPSGSITRVTSARALAGAALRARHLAAARAPAAAHAKRNLAGCGAESPGLRLGPSHPGPGPTRPSAMKQLDSAQHSSIRLSASASRWSEPMNKLKRRFCWKVSARKRRQSYSCGQALTLTKLCSFSEITRELLISDRVPGGV